MSPRDGAGTRQRILDVAQALILDHGFAATSIEEIIRQVGITKGAFFYHFKSKQQLAQELIDRYAQSDVQMLQESLSRADDAATDPLGQLLAFVDRYIEMGEAFTEPFPGCLFASYSYESGQFEPSQLQRVDEVFHIWRDTLTAKLEQVAAAHPPRMPVDLPSLADLLTSVFEGAYIMSRVMDEAQAFAAQLRHYRTYLQLLFGDEKAPAVARSRAGRGAGR